MTQKTEDTQVAALRDEISHTRDELGDTVAALATRADVGSRARDSARRTAVRMRTASASPEVMLVYAAGIAALVSYLFARRRNR